jgi:methylenetetrahydrofolate dehydrogenase (NADP+)/methenyltetrahydrofolate cyclohydrolase
MPAKILDGKALAARLQAEMAAQVQAWIPQVGRPPGLAVLRVGEDPASAAYVRGKERACERLGIASFGRHFSAQDSPAHLLDTIDQLNQDERVDGILVQLPLPPGWDPIPPLLAINPDKDVDGLHPLNLGRLLRGEPGLRSCTPLGVMRLLQAEGIPIAGRKAVVVGRSILVGKPLSLMLLAADATVTLAHSRTPDLAEVTRAADIVVMAVGRPRLLRADMVKPGAVVMEHPKVARSSTRSRSPHPKTGPETLPPHWAPNSGGFHPRRKPPQCLRGRFAAVPLPSSAAILRCPLLQVQNPSGPFPD